MPSVFDGMDDSQPQQQPAKNASISVFDGLDNSTDDMKSMMTVAQSTSPQEAQSKLTPPNQAPDASKIPPKTQAFALQSGDHTAAMMPNMEHFSTMENLWNEAKRIQSFNADVGRGMWRGIFHAGSSFAALGVGAITTMAKGEGSTIEDTPGWNGPVMDESHPGKVLYPALTEEQKDKLRQDDKSFMNTGNAISDALDKEAEKIYTRFDGFNYDQATQDIKDGNYKRLTENLIGVTGEAIPTLMSYFAAPETAPLAFAVQGGKDTKEQDIKSGASDTKSGVDAYLNTAFNVALNYLFMNKGVNGFFKSSLNTAGKESTLEAALHYAKTIGKTSGLMGATSFASTAESEGSKKALGISDESIKQIIENALFEGIKSLPTGLVAMRHAGEAYEIAKNERNSAQLNIQNAASNQMASNRASTASEVDQEMLSNAFKTYESNKANDFFKTKHLDAIVGDDQKLYVDPQVFEDYAKSQGVSGTQAARDLGGLDEYERAKKSNGKIAFKPSSIISSLAGTPHADAASEMFTTDPARDSVAEMKTNAEKSTVDKKETSGNMELNFPKSHEDLESQLAKARQEGFTHGRRNRLTELPSVEEFNSSFVPGYHQVAAVDMDGLGAANEVLGHQGADSVVRQFGAAIRDFEKQNNGDIQFYHRHGDEFSVLAKPGVDLQGKLEEFQKYADNLTTHVYTKIGEGKYDVHAVKGPRFSFGIGDGNGKTAEESYHSADESTKLNKRGRSAQRESVADVKATGKSRFISKIAEGMAGERSPHLHQQGGGGEVSGVVPGERIPSTFFPTAGNESVLAGLPGDLSKSQEADGQIVHAIENKLRPYTPLLDQMGATGETANKYAGWIKSVYDSVKKEVGDKILTQKDRIASKAFKDQLSSERSNAEKSATKEFEDSKELSAAEDVRKILKENIGGTYERDNTLIDIPEAYRYKDSPELQFVAEMHGYGSVDEMLKAAAMLPEKEDFVKKRGDQAVNGYIEEDAVEHAISDDEAIDMAVADKLKTIARKTVEEMASDDFSKTKGLLKKIVGKPRTAIETESLVRSDMQQMKVSEVSSTAAKRTAEKMNKQALDLLLKGDFQGMFDAKQKEEYNHELFKQAKELEKDREKTESFAKKSSLKSYQEKIAKAGQDSVGQLESLKSRFGLPGRSFSGEPVMSISDYAAQMQNRGYKVGWGPVVMDGRQAYYKDLPVKDFNDLKDAIFNIKNMAEKEGVVHKGAEAVNLEDSAEEIKTVIGANRDISPKPDNQINPDLKKKFKTGIAMLHAFHINPDFATDWLAGWNKLSAPWMWLTKPLIESDNLKNDLNKKFLQPAFDHIDENYKPKEFREFMNKKYFIPELKSDYFDGNMSRENMVKALMLHGTISGNERASGLTDEQVNAIARNMQPKDFDLIDRLWKMSEDFWPTKKEHQFKMTGISPRASESKPFDVKLADGSTRKMSGGYCHISFVDKASVDEQHNANVQDMFGRGTNQIKTKQGNLITRVGTGGREVDLTLNSIFRDMDDSMHDVSHREAVIDYLKLIKHPDVQRAITNAGGKEFYDSFEKNIRSVARSQNQDPWQWFSKQFQGLRSKTTMMEIGANAATGLLHAPNMLIPMTDIGAKNMLKGILHMSNPLNWDKNIEEMESISKTMKYRNDAGDQNLREILDRSTIGKAAKDTAYKFLRYVDKVTACALWHGSYAKCFNEGLPKSGVSKGDHQAAVDYADSLVTQAKGNSAAWASSQAKNIHFFGGLFNSFYTPGNVFYQQMWKATDKFEKTKDIGGYMASMTLAWWLPSAFKTWIKGGKDWDYLKDEATYPFMGVLFLRDMVSAVQYASGRGKVEPEFSPVPKLADAAVESFIAQKKWFTGEDFTRQDFNNMAETASLFKPLPMNQMLKTTEYLWDWEQGNISPEQVMGVPGTSIMRGIWESLVTGEKPEKN